jgi:hypothetical protein
MIALLARWALRKGLLPSHDELETIQGQLGIVTQEIASGGIGAISYEYLGKRLQSPARAISNHLLEKGADVVIDRIEDGVAFVEEWAVVEQRL